MDSLTVCFVSVVLFPGGTAPGPPYQLLCSWSPPPTAYPDLTVDNKKVYVACLVYGVEACITTVACISEVYFLDMLSTAQRTNLLMLYFPTALIPLGIAFDFGQRILQWIPAKEKAKLL